jgi:cyanuric acid amidohydrolase
MQDALDIGSVTALARDLGFSPEPQVPAAQARRIRAAFVKCEAQRDGTIRGRPHTMLNDGDIDQQRHIRGAVGAIVAAVLNDTALFVSGGAEHQGPDGGGFFLSGTFVFSMLVRSWRAHFAACSWATWALT